MDRERLLDIMRNPEILNDRDLPEITELLNHFPFFQSARMLYVKNLRNQGYANYPKCLRETAIYITNRTKLFFLLDERVILKDNEVSAQKIIEDQIIDFQKLSDATDSVIGRKAKAKAEEEKKKAATEAIRNMITSGGSGEYFGKVDDTLDLNSFKETFGKKQQTPTKAERHASLLDGFTGFNIERPKVTDTPKANDDSVDLSLKSSTENADLMSETLAQIYVKTKAYEKAIAMYEKMCLKYPEKKPYFAERIKEIKANIK